MDAQQNSESPSRPPARQPIPFNKQPYVTYTLLGLIAAAFLLQIAANQNDPGQDLTGFGGLNVLLVAHGDYYRLLTSMFLHADSGHIFSNGITLYFIGQTVEFLYGHRRMALIYFIGGFAGSVASLVLNNNFLALSIGASGAIFALIGAELGYLYFNRQWLNERATSRFRTLLFFIGLNFFIDIAARQIPGGIQIDYWAHFGGLVAGLALAWLIGPKYQEEVDPNAPSGKKLVDVQTESRVWMISAAVTVGLVVILALRLAAVSHIAIN